METRKSQIDDVVHEEPIFLDLTKNMTILPLGGAREPNSIQIGLFIFYRGFVETEIVSVVDKNKIELIANSEYFNGNYKRFHFNKGQENFVTEIINLKNFESDQEKELANIIISFLKEKNLSFKKFVKFDITVPKTMANYFIELKS